VRVVERDAFADRARGLEEEYARKRDAELIAKLRLRAATEAEQERLGAQVGTADEEILQELRDLGYTPDTVSLLQLVPLIETAWSGGRVTEPEHAVVVQAARTRGVETGSPADQQLLKWLSSRPSDRFFERTLRALRAVLESRPEAERETGVRDLLALCTSVAQASGGVFGIGAISADERKVLARITSALDPAHGSGHPQGEAPGGSGPAPA
jgi:hypothetical protein